MTDDQANELLLLLRMLLDELRELSPRSRAHKCYRCGRLTMLGTAWCQSCLDDAARHNDRYPLKPKPRLPNPKRPI